MLRPGRKKKDMPDGLFVKCDGCGEMVYRKNVEELLEICPECGHHFRIGARARVALHTDEGSFDELDADMTACDPLGFVAAKSYQDQVAGDIERTGLNEAVIYGTCRIEGRSAVFCAMESAWRGGSMGSVVGEKVTRAVELAMERELPLVTVSASGGARMQESAYSLMQMAKTCAALERFHRAGGAYVSIMTHPTTGGVTASWASMADVTMAEPGALIGFAGPRVIKETIGEELPDEFQTAEFLLEHGFLDLIAERKDIKATVAGLLDYLA
ncbi:MAG: acetyl-CoA carboxylase, carboxyltransferase subunit beta [Candidatus Brocadiia bacterium]